MQKHKTTVCVITYNQEKYIEETLKGIFLQEDCDFDIVIADDHSSDGTFGICMKYADMYPERITLIKQPENKGVVVNTKDCLLAATGEYIAICEGDDYWTDPHKLHDQIKILDEEPAVSMVHTNWTDFIQDTGQFNHNANKSADDFCEKENGIKSVEHIMLNRYKSIRLSSVLFRADIIHRFINEHQDLFNPSYTTLDIGLFYILAYNGLIRYIPRSTTVYRLQSESVSVTKDYLKSARFSLGVIRMYAYFIKTYNLSTDCRNKAFRRSLQYLCPYSLHFGRNDLATEIFNITAGSGYNLRFGHKLCLAGARYKLLRPFLKILLRTDSIFNKSSN